MRQTPLMRAKISTQESTAQASGRWIDRRNALIRLLDDDLHPDTSDAERLAYVGKALWNYLPRWLKADRYRLDPPSHYGRKETLLFQIFRESDGKVPRSDKQLRRVLLSR
jgi:hypothetical protein